MRTQISQILIVDTFGTKHCKFSPRSITRITGPNGCGKSSILRALTRIFEGGSDPSVIRHGAEKSIVEIRLDDGTVITRSCAPKKRRKTESAEYLTNLEILQPDGTPRAAPQSYIASLSEAVAVDPGQILRIDVTTAPGRKQLANELLRIMPIEFTAEDVAMVMDAPYRPDSTTCHFNAAGLSLPSIEHPLDLDGLRKYIGLVTEQRRRVGITRDDAEGTVKRLRQSLPDDDGTDYQSAVDQAEAYRLDVERAIGARRLEIEQQSASVLAEVELAYQTAVAEIDRDIDAQILALEKQKSARKAEKQADRDGARGMISSATVDEITALFAEAKPVIDKTTVDIATLKEKLANRQRAKFQREEIEHQQTTYAEAGTKYDMLSEALIRLDLMRAEKLKSLPIPDLVVEGDQVLLGGTPWQNVNTAKRVEVALQLCTLRSGDLGVLFLDDAEHLDAETRGILEEGIAAAGFQLIEAIVSDETDLRIETFDHDETVSAPVLA